jgi:hypothetical protein
MERSKQSAIICIIALGLCTAAPGKIIYVDDDAPPGGDGTSWASAYRFVQDALADANDSAKPVEVRVARGIYRPNQAAGIAPGDREATFRLISAVTLKGGYAGQGEPDPDHRDTTLYETILSGDLKGDDRPFRPWGRGDEDAQGVADWEGHAEDNSYHVVTADGTDGLAVLDGFVIRAGNDDRRTGAGRDIVVWLGYGGGMIASGGAQVRNCTFTENFAGTGGGLYCEDANLVVEDCAFSRNCARRGGGAYVKGSEARFVNCVVSANCLHTLISSTPQNGVGLACDMSQMTITRCQFTGNWTVGWGGIANLNQSRATISHSLFTGNMAGNGSGIYNRDSALSVTNCTFHENRSYAIVCWSEHSPAIADVANCILASWDQIDNRAGSIVRIKYSSIEHGKAQVRDLDPNGGVIWGQGNLEAVPYFAAPGRWDDPNTPDALWDDRWIDGDYHLKSLAGRWDPNEQRWVMDDVTSPCIDAGDPNSPVGDEPEPNGGRINMGAYGGTAEASKSRLPKTFNERLQDLLATLEGQSAERPTIRMKWGYAHFLATPGTHFAVDPDYRGPPEKAANWFLQQWRDLFVSASSAVSFELSRISVSALTSRSNVRFRQEYASLQIYDAEITIEVGQDGSIETVISGIQSDTSPLDTGTVSLTPSMDAATAQDKAIAFFAERYQGRTLEASAPVLMIYAPSVLGFGGPIRLVWNVEVRGVSEVLVDARDGEIVLWIPLLIVNR